MIVNLHDRPYTNTFMYQVSIRIRTVIIFNKKPIILDFSLNQLLVINIIIYYKSIIIYILYCIFRI